MSDINPSNTDAVLGGQNPPPVDAAILGGEIGRKLRLQHEKAIARANKFWQNFEYLDDLPDRHATIFADRQVVNFEMGMEIINPKETAYALRVPKSGRMDDLDRLNISRNFLWPLGRSRYTYDRYMELYPEVSKIKCELIVNNQRPDDPKSHRYCSVGE